MNFQFCPLQHALPRLMSLSPFLDPPSFLCYCFYFQFNFTSSIFAISLSLSLSLHPISFSFSIRILPVHKSIESSNLISPRQAAQYRASEAQLRQPEAGVARLGGQMTNEEVKSLNKRLELFLHAFAFQFVSSKHSIPLDFGLGSGGILITNLFAFMVTLYIANVGGCTVGGCERAREEGGPRVKGRVLGRERRERNESDRELREK
ncbi:hypothetical protein DVH24_032895 [Malus domestica]|uniref:Uncharacterized protein n=1 Tax=Malus domestica TaxID=3750 RepID=A0A498IT33_MALDO|nr:hypothetical protein DVH24_032895 [Malus domestica]